MISDEPSVSADPAQEIQNLKRKLAEAEATLQAIRSGAVDALVVSGRKGEEEIRSILDMGSLGDSLFNQVAQPIFILDRAYRILRSNKQAQDLCGSNPTSRLFSEVLPLAPTVEDHDHLPADLSTDWIGERKHIAALDVTHFHPELGTRYYLMDTSPIHLSWERVQGGIVTMMDITERKLAEIRLAVKAGQLRQQFTFMKSISDNIAEGLILLDEDHKVIFQNPAASMLLGVAESDLTGRDLSDVFRIESLSGERREIAWKTPGSGEGADGPSQRVWLHGSSGRRTPVEYSVYPIKDDDEIRGSILVVGDISDRLAVEKQLMLSMEKQQQSQKMEAIGRLAGGIAHDFNNLLLVILGFTDLTLQEFDLEPAASENLREVRKAGEKAAALTAQLLAYSRKQVLAPKVGLINDAVRDLRKMMGRFIGENIRLELLPTGEDLSVDVDQAKLQQVLVNLLLNAKDAMPDGGELSIRTGSMKVRLTDMTGMVGEIRRESEEGVPAGSYAFIEIEDSGHGMSAEVLAHLFEPFFTTKEFGKGSGLGLSTAYGIIRQLGGHMQVFTEVGKGSIFKVILPLHAERPVPLLGTLTEPSQLPKATGMGKTVLLVEDEDVVRNLLCKILKDDGFRVIEARNGGDALAKLSETKGPIDLVVTDLIMNGMGGIELAKRLSRSRPELAILFMSGYSEDQYTLPLIGGGPAHFASKPFGPGDLLAKIRSILSPAPEHKGVDSD